MKKAALLLCTLLLAALAGCQLGGKAIILPKAGNITAIQVETLEGESLSLTQEEDIARLLRIGPRQCWPILHRMLADRQITRDGQKYTLLKREA